MFRLSFWLLFPCRLISCILHDHPHIFVLVQAPSHALIISHLLFLSLHLPFLSAHLAFVLSPSSPSYYSRITGLLSLAFLCSWPFLRSSLIPYFFLSVDHSSSRSVTSFSLNSPVLSLPLYPFVVIFAISTNLLLRFGHGCSGGGRPLWSEEGKKEKRCFVQLVDASLTNARPKQPRS